MTDYIPLEKLEQIRLSQKSKSDIELKNFERLNENEVMYYGRMYDIYKEECRNDTIILYCLSDEREDVIEKAFAEYINEKNNDKNISAVTNIIKILITLGIQPEFNDCNYLILQTELLSLYSSSITKIIIDIPSPPPKFTS